MGEYFPVREESRNLAKSGKVKGILPKILENQKNYTGKDGKICQPVIVKTPEMWYHTSKKTFKNTGKLQKYWKSQGNCQPEKVGSMKK